MTYQIIFLFCLCDEFIKQAQLRDNHQSKMSHAEIMTFAITAALFFNGNFARTRLFFLSHKYFSHVLSRSRINKKIHLIPADLWHHVFFVFRAIKISSSVEEFIIDSFPVPVCQNSRTWRCKLFSSKKYHGYCAAKKSYFWGLKVHMIVTKQGIPYEFFFSPASMSDVHAIDFLNLDLPDGACLYADKGYNSYSREDFLRDVGIELIAQRKKNSRRPHSGAKSYLQQVCRKRIETTFSCITRNFPKRIHAVTAKGFYMKLLLFILAFCVEL